MPGLGTRKLLILRNATYAKRSNCGSGVHGGYTERGETRWQYQSLGTRKNLTLRAPAKLQGGALNQVRKTANAASR